MDRGALSGSGELLHVGSSPALTAQDQHHCPCVFQQQALPCVRGDLTLPGLRPLLQLHFSTREGGHGCSVPSLTDKGCEMSLKPPRNCFSPKYKELWEPGEPKHLQVWRWAAWLIPPPCEHSRGLESWKEPPALTGLHHDMCGAPPGRRVSWPAWQQQTLQPSLLAMWCGHHICRRTPAQL